MQPKASMTHMLRLVRGDASLLMVAVLASAGAPGLATAQGEVGDDQVQKAPSSPTIEVLPRSSRGWFRLRGEGDGPIHQVLTSADLMTWETNAVIHHSPFVFTDPTSSGVERRYYRVASRGDTPRDDWKNVVDYPNDHFLSESGGGLQSAMPRWIKFTIDLSEPNRVIYQHSGLYQFHYDFITNRIERYQGMSSEELDAISLYPEDQELVLGAVLFPPGGVGAAPPNEFGIQFVGQEAYAKERIRDLFHLVASTVDAPSSTKAFYMPTLAQEASAKAHSDYLSRHGIAVTSSERWVSGNNCYSQGWALGTLKFFPADEINVAFADGRLGSSDILLTDGIPAEVPPVAGIISLAPATPNSHVAIKARSDGVPFVFLSQSDDRGRAKELAGDEVFFQAMGDEAVDGAAVSRCRLKLFAVDDSMEPAVKEEILAFKEDPPLEIQPMERLGQLSVPTDDLVPADTRYVGGKAANYGLLRRTIPDHSRDAIAFSFDLWNGFLDQELPSGKTLRETIEERLGKYTEPPENMFQLRADLNQIRHAFIYEAEFTQSQREAILSALERFDADRSVRFRSSTNVEDTEAFTGAGLYSSFSGCVADSLDDDAIGPSHCDPDEDEEQGVFQAIKQVFASFYNDNAFLERLRHDVDPADVGMGLLVHHSFPDETELANGVASLNVVGSGGVTMQGELVTQKGATSVTNPEDNIQPEVVSFRVSPIGGTEFNLVARSSLVPLGGHVMQWSNDYDQLAGLLVSAAEGYQELFPEKDGLSLDFEYKRVAPDELVVKQIREIPSNAGSGSETPEFLLNEPTNLRVLQGEAGNVFGLHRLKSRWHLETANLRLTDEALQESFYREAEVEYVEDGAIRELEASIPSLPNASHRTEDRKIIDQWEMVVGGESREYTLETRHVRSPLGRGRLFATSLPDWSISLNVTYPTEHPSADFGEITTTTNDFVQLVPPTDSAISSKPENQRRQTRRLETKGGVVIETSFYWPPKPSGPIAGYTAPLVRWEETRIEGLTSSPIRLTGYYSQTYRPEHHNFSEHFLFEPRLEEDLPEATLEELQTANVRLIYFYWNGDNSKVKFMGTDGEFRSAP